jgi:hypothetical protein
MKDPIVIIGIGEIGSVFARGFLKTGHPVYPVTRDMDFNHAVHRVPEPELVLVTVGENDLDNVLAKLPEPWQSNLALIQNELLPHNWQQHQIANPTVASIWFEKKAQQSPKVLVPSPIYGPHAGLLKNALNTLNIPCNLLESETQLLFELVRKNYYILASNICGLKTGGTVSELWDIHENFVREVLQDIHAIQEHLTQQPLDKDALLEAMLIAFEGDPQHGCMGRSAPARLQRALAIAKQADISVPYLQAISSINA